MQKLRFCVLRNTDDTLSVYFSDHASVHEIQEEDIDDSVFDYKPDIDKKQVFDFEQFVDDTCH